MEQKGVKPKDHMKENYRQLKELQVKHQEERAEADRDKPELYKMSQFQHVPSRLYEEDRNPGHAPKQGSGEFLSRGQSERRREILMEERRQIRAEMEAKLQDAREIADQPETPRKESIPRGPAALAPRSQKDFISQNRVAAQVMETGHREDDAADTAVRHKSYGRVPRYLEDRKSQWAEEEEERKRNLPDPDCPRGMCKMPESERLETLDVLRRSLQEANAQLSAMPFVIETPSLRKKQVDLEMKIKEIERAIGIFSKPKVYIAMDK